MSLLQEYKLVVPTTGMNTLRVEVFDYDDSPVDDEPDFLGQVVLTVRGPLNAAGRKRRVPAHAQGELAQQGDTEGRVEGAL